MREITTAQALAWFESRKTGIAIPGAMAMYNKAIVALRAQLEAEENKPLAIDELREMAKKSKLTKAEIIKSLLDQALDKDRLASGDPESIFALDSKALREAAELLKAAPEWINVKDRMPESDDEVLVYYSDFDMMAVGMAGMENGNVKWYVDTDTDKYPHTDYAPDFWMPLPEPPEKEKKNEQVARNGTAD